MLSDCGLFFYHMSIKLSPKFRRQLHFYWLAQVPLSSALSYIKNGQRTWIAIFPKKTYRWSIGSWNDAQRHEWLAKGKPNRDEVSPRPCWGGCSQRQEVRAGEDVRRREPVYCWWLVHSWWKKWWKKSTEVFQKIKNRITQWPSNPTSACIPERRASTLKEIPAPPCSLQHYSQQSGQWNDPSVPRRMNG